MYCSKCGEKLKDDMMFCPKCGNQIGENQMLENQVKHPSKISGNSSKIKCPSCGGTNLQCVTESQTRVKSEGGGYSGTKGCLGYLLMGPFGLLCGSCGNSQKTTVTEIHKHFWVCTDCGCKFPTLEDLEAEIEQKKVAMKSAFLGPVFVIACIILLISGQIEESFFLTALGVYIAILGFVLCALYLSFKKQIQVKETEYEELKKKIKM